MSLEDYQAHGPCVLIRTSRCVAGTIVRCGLPSPSSVQTGRGPRPAASQGSVLRFSLDIALMLTRQENIHSHLLDFPVGKDTLFLPHQPKTAMTSVRSEQESLALVALPRRSGNPSLTPLCAAGERVVFVKPGMYLAIKQSRRTLKEAFPT